MKAVILVGGEGTRLRPLTFKTPKSMVPILNRPFLEHMIDYLRGHGIDDIILTLCYLPHHIQRYFGDGSKFGVRLTNVVEECPLGTAGAVKNVEECLDETFFVLNGDIFTDIDLTAMMDFHRQRRSRISIALTPVDNPTIYGVVETNSEGRVRRFIEKPSPEAVTTNVINAGAYIVEPEVLSHIPKGLRFTFEQGLFPLLVERGDPVYGYQSDAYWIDIGTPEKYLQLHHDLLTGRVKKSFHGERIDEGIWVEEGCEIHRRAELEGPLVIGKDCVIASRAQVKGPSVIGPDCTIGMASLIEGAIVWQNTRLGRRVSLRRCVIAENVVIGDGCQVMEGCVLGDNVVIGPGESLSQGTKLGPQKPV